MQEEKGAVLQEPRLSVKDRIQFFKDLSKSQGANTLERRTTYTNRNIFERKKSPHAEPQQPLRNTQVVSSTEQPVVKRQGSKVGTLISFFSAKIQDAENERQRHSQIQQRREQRRSESSSTNSIKYEISHHQKYDSSTSPQVAPQQAPPTFHFQENKSYLERNTISESKNKHQEDYLSSLRDHPTVATRITDPAPSYFQNLYRSDNSESEGNEHSFSFQSPRPGVVGFPGLGKTEESISSEDSPRQLKNRGPTISEELDTISYLREKKKVQNEALEKDASEVVSDMLAKVMDQEAQKIIAQASQFVKEEKKAMERVFSEILIHSMVDEVVKESLDDHIRSAKVASLARQVHFSLQDEFIRTIVKEVVSQGIYEQETERAACNEIIEESMIDQEIVENAFVVYQQMKDANFLEKVAHNKSEQLFSQLLSKIVKESCKSALEYEIRVKKKQDQEGEEWSQAQERGAEDLLLKLLKQEVKSEVKLSIAEALAKEQREKKQLKVPRIVLDDILRQEVRNVVRESVQSVENENTAIELYFQEKLCSSFYETSVRECCRLLLKQREQELLVIEAVGLDILEKVKMKLVQEVLEEEKDQALAQEVIFSMILESGAQRVLYEAGAQAFSEYENANNVLGEIVTEEIQKLAFQTLMEERRRERQSLKQTSFSFYSSTDVRKKKYSCATVDGEELNWLGNLEMSQIERREQQNESTGDILTIQDKLGSGIDNTDSDSLCGDECNAEPEQEMKINQIKEFRSLRLMQELQLHHSLPIDANFIDVLCVNCYECVKLTDVNTHSRTCQKPLSKPIEVQSDKNLVDINDRIFKLTKSIELRLKDLRQAPKPNKKLSTQEVQEYEAVLSEISHLGNQIFINNSYPIDLHLLGSKLQTMVFSLTLTRSFYFSTKVYAERLIQLLGSKLEMVEGMCQQSSEDDIFRQTENIGDPFLNEMLMEEELKDIEAKFNDEQLNLAHVQVIQNRMLNQFMKQTRERRQAGMSEVNSEVEARGPLSVYSSTTTGLQSVKNLY